VEENDEPKISRRTAMIAAVAIVIVLALMGYYAIGGFKTSKPAVTATPTPQASATVHIYNESSLVSEYSIGGTPILVFGCSMQREGLASSLYANRDAVERQDIINALCSETGKSAFCAIANTEQAVPATQTGKASCDNEKAVIYAFHSPSCAASETQRVILDKLAADYPNYLEVRYICTLTTQSDLALCNQAVGSGLYDE